MNHRLKTFPFNITVGVVVVGLLFVLEETIRFRNTGLEGKTLWNWMELLIIPLFLAVGAYLLESSERAVQNEIATTRISEDLQLAEKRAELDREIALDRQQEEALQVYLDRMAHLLIEKDLRAAENEEVQNVARTRTLTVLRGLDAKRKGLVLKFLYEAGLISRDKMIVDLSSADLEGAILTDTNLRKANLSEVNLKFADLQSANLHGANLSRANLEGAKLQNAIFYKTELPHANLTDAHLDEANLQKANLTDAIVSITQLNSARFLNGATMPDRTIHD